MVNIIGVRFKEVGKVYYFDPLNFHFAKGDKVIVETSYGIECGEVVIPNKLVANNDVVSPLRKVIRRADKIDLARIKEIERSCVYAINICKNLIEKHNLQMKLIDVEYSFDNKKILFYFTADGRIDFRELVRDLAYELHARIELRQVGVRDEAKIIGGLGICGREYCCKGFLPDFQPVSIKMAKEQGLSLNPIKISGSCGRLMCCLKYEQDAYSYLLKQTPKIGSAVNTNEGKGVITEVNLLMGKVKVKLDDLPDSIPKEFTLEELIKPHNKTNKKNVKDHAKKH